MDIVLDPFTSKIVLAVATGTVISGLAALSKKDGTEWGWKKYLYTLGLATVSGLVVADTAENGVTGDNAIALFLEIVGASFLANKLFGVGQKLKEAL